MSLPFRNISKDDINEDNLISMKIKKDEQVYLYAKKYLK